MGIVRDNGVPELSARGHAAGFLGDAVVCQHVEQGERKPTDSEGDRDGHQQSGVLAVAPGFLLGTGHLHWGGRVAQPPPPEVAANLPVQTPQNAHRDDELEEKNQSAVDDLNLVRRPLLQADLVRHNAVDELVPVHFMKQQQRQTHQYRDEPYRTYGDEGGGSFRIVFEEGRVHYDLEAVQGDGGDCGSGGEDVNCLEIGDCFAEGQPQHPVLHYKLDEIKRHTEGT